MTTWLIAELNPQSPVFWLLINLVVTVVLVAVFWRSRPEWATWLWIGQWILIPYCGLLLGGLSPRLMGLSNLDWVATLGLGSGLLFIFLVLLAAVRIAAEFSEKLPSEPPTTESLASSDRNIRQTPVWQFATLVILVSGAEEFHWVFLRGAVWEILLTSPTSPELPAYWAIWIAALFVIFESALRRLSREQWLIQITLLTTTSILFLYTRNFWLCWILHSASIMILTANGHSQAYPLGQITNHSR